MNNSTNGRICQPVILVHGGAWTIPDALLEESRQGVKESAIRGYGILENGGSSIDAVENAVVSLEDNPVFDAGRGSVLNEAGEVETHAFVMRGDTCDIGGVLCLKHVKNPVKAARLVLDKSHHCLLDGTASLKLARQHHLEERPLEYFVTKMMKDELKQCSDYGSSINQFFDSHDGHDTVGAVALDCYGNVACATSTGGINAQMVGRVSDSPITGCGGFADNQSAAVSTTGHGESIMKVNLARMISLNVENGMPPQLATEKSISHMKKRVNGCGGAIVVDTEGRAAVHFTTQKMSWARIGGKSTNEIAETSHMVEYGCDLKDIRREKF